MPCSVSFPVKNVNAQHHCQSSENLNQGQGFLEHYKGKYSSKERGCGKYDSGQVELNGGAANFFKPGDWVHVNCFAFYDPNNEHIPDMDIVYTDENNNVIKIDQHHLRNMETSCID